MQSPEGMLYIATMIRVINKILSFSSQPALSESEQGIRSRDWTEVLFGVVPQDRLIDTLNYAYAGRSSVFPISLPEFRTAWETMDAAERKAAAEARARNEYAVETCPAKHRHDPVDELNPDEGMVDYVDWFDRNLDVTMPCDICRPTAHAQARARHIEKNGGQDLGPVVAEETVKKLCDRVIVPETADEVLMKAQTQIRDTDVFILLQHARNWLRYGKTEIWYTIE